MPGWFVPVFLSRVLCVSRQYFSAKFARPLFSDRFTLRLLLTRYFALYSALRAPTGPGGRTVPTELCSLSRKLIILFVTDNKYFTHDSRSHPAQLQRIKSRLAGSNCHQSQSKKYYDTHSFIFTWSPSCWCHLLKNDRLLRAVVFMNMQVSCNKAINMLGYPPRHALFRQFSYLIAGTGSPRPLSQRSVHSFFQHFTSSHQ